MNDWALAAFAISVTLFSGHVRAQDAQTDTSEPTIAAEASRANAGSAAPAAPDASSEAKAQATPIAQPAERPRAAPASSIGTDSATARRPPVYGKRGDWNITPYGYARFDAIEDSTQSFDDGIQPNLIARVGTYRGDHRRAIFTARDSRLGVFIGPRRFRASRHPANRARFLRFASVGRQEARSSLFGPVRLRHAYLKLETSVVDVIAGQYYDLFGWGSYFYPATVAYLGVPGEIYHRNPQLRLEKKVQAGALEVMVAAAAVRPGQRDAGGIPDVEGGLKVAYNGWSGIATPGFGRPAVAPVSLGVSGLYRHFEVPEFRASRAPKLTPRTVTVSPRKFCCPSSRPKRLKTNATLSPHR